MDGQKIQPYLKHHCQGRYWEPKSPWEAANLCTMCDLNLECYELRKQKREEGDHDAPTVHQE